MGPEHLDRNTVWAYLKDINDDKNRQDMKKEVEKALRELGFRESELLVYLTLTTLGEASAAQVSKKTSLPRTTIISILERFTEEGYISRHKERGRNQYWIESPRVLVDVLERRAQVAKSLESILGDMYRSDTKSVSAEVYDNQKSIQRFTERILLSLSAKEEVRTIDSPQKKNYQSIFSEYAYSQLLKVKQQKNIHTKTLIPKKGEKSVENESLKNQLISIRVLPEAVNFEASIWILQDSLVLFSGTQPLVIHVKHPLICKSMQSIFEYLWTISVERDI